jgi:hypothetical protein
MSLSISAPSNSYTTNTTASAARDIASAALDVMQSITQLAQTVLQQAQGAPSQPQPVQQPVPADRFEAAYQSMEPANAAKIVLDNFNAIEGVGVDASGAGAGDSNIGRRELERVADPNSGFPPEVRAAVKWLLDHPTAARSLDQGASQAHGDANEYHFSKEDLQAIVANTPVSAPSATSVPRPPEFQPATTGVPGSSGFETPAAPLVDLCPTGSTFAAGEPHPYAPAPKPMDIYSAAQTLKDHFKFAEGVGMDESGRGAGDNNIGLSELKRLAEPNSGAPAELRDAAKFLLDHRTALRSVDQGASQSQSSEEVHINLNDLEAFTASAPKKNTVSTAVGLAQLARQMTIFG